ncbi:MAG: T9SS type A sorting domain-containing protein, partial [Saprospiraceae bacterium]|nr:T9SS type A sorting domain-containing protein [Saprospiraceae bacterium]
TSNADTSRHTGWYGTGNAVPGAYFVFAEKKGYYPKIYNNIVLNTNEVTILDIELEPVLTNTNAAFGEAQIEVNPVPFSGFINVSIVSGTSKIVRAELLDTNGRLVKQTWSVSGTHLQMDSLDDLAPGTYILKLTNDQAETYIRKVLKYGG